MVIHNFLQSVRLLADGMKVSTNTVQWALNRIVSESIITQ